MKKHILIAACILFTAMAARSQATYPPTPEYEYAMLRVIDDDISFVVEYSNTGEEVKLSDVLNINREEETFTHARFRCFDYLNGLGYELVSSNSYYDKNKSGFGQKLKCEYIFKRLKK